MGAVGGILGLNGGVNGTGVQGPQSANIVNPVTADQLSQANTASQNALTGQQGLLTALQGQNGLQNQSQVYGQLQGIASGAVNPAQAQFNQNTGQNVANQAALMAGQRGAGANVGLMARQAAQTGAGIQQNAVGQEASQQATNQINAIGQAGSLATTQAGQQINQTNQNTASQQAQQQALLNAQAGVNTANVQNQASINAANAGAAQSMTGILGSGIGGLAQGAGASLMKAAPAAALVAQGGDINNAPIIEAIGPQSRFAQHLSKRGASFAQGGMVPVLLSPGEIKLSPDQAKAVAAGKLNPMAVGQEVPGKPKIGGAKNSYANDFVQDKVPAHTIIVPRSEAKSKDPVNNSIRFVQDTLAKRKVRK